MTPSRYPLQVEELYESARVRLRLRGELDLSTLDPVADRLCQLRDLNAIVLLDIDELTFIDARGLRLVLTAALDARNDGWAFTVTRGSGPVRRVFELLDLDRHMPFDGS